MDARSPTSPSSPVDAPLRPGLIETRDEILQALPRVLMHCARQGGRELLLMDRDFADWPLSDAAVLDALRQWALPHRKLRLLAQDFETTRRVHPRFVQWRQLHDHVISARSYDATDLERSRPTPEGLVLAPGLLVFSLWTPTRASLTLSDAREEATMREWFDATEQRSADSFAGSTLGL